MPQTLNLAVAQVFTQPTLCETIAQLRRTAQLAVTRSVDILLFPEAYLGGYPRTCNFGAAIGSRAQEGRDQFLAYYNSAVDLGDTPRGAGDAWINRTLSVNELTGRRGDGTREQLEAIAKDTGVFIVTGVVERSGGSLFCSALYIDPVRGVLGKRRKLMPTASERLVWSQGTASTLKVVTTVIRGVRVTMGCAICWENFMPLLRYSLYAQNVNLWFAPTADARDTWESLMKTVGNEGRCFVMSANQCQRRSHLPDWITGGKSKKKTTDEQSIGENVGSGSFPGRSDFSLSKRRKSSAMRTEENHEIVLPIRNGDSKGNVEVQPSAVSSSAVLSEVEEDDFVSRGGSCIISPFGQTLAGPLWEETEELLVTEVDFEDCARGKLDFDAAGHYSRSDAFHLTVEGLDLNPPA